MTVDAQLGSGYGELVACDATGAARGYHSVVGPSLATRHRDGLARARSHQGLQGAIPIVVVRDALDHVEATARRLRGAGQRHDGRV